MSAEPDEFAELAPVQSRENLRRRFPQSPRLIIERSIWALVAFLLALYGMLQPLETASSDYQRNLYVVLSGLLLTVIAGSIIKILYEVWYYLTYSYVLELENLNITRGVLFRNRYSIAIAKINDVTIKRNPLELLLRIYTLSVLSVPVEGVGEGLIQGLNRRRAAELQTYVLALLQTTLPHIQKGAANAAVPPPADMQDDADKGGTGPAGPE